MLLNPFLLLALINLMNLINLLKVPLLTTWFSGYQFGTINDKFSEILRLGEYNGTYKNHLRSVCSEYSDIQIYSNIFGRIYLFV